MSRTDKIVDEILVGDYKKVKLAEQAGDLVDVILDNCGKPHGKKKKMMENEEYKAYFKDMLKKHGYDSPADIPADKKKEFFNAVDAGWKGEKVEEIANTIDHVPDESAEGEHDKIKDQLGKDEKKLEEVENALDSKPKEDADEELSSLEDEMSKEEEARTESAVDLVRKAFKSVREERDSKEAVKEDETNPVYLVRKAFKSIREEKAIVKEDAAGIGALIGAGTLLAGMGVAAVWAIYRDVIASLDDKYIKCGRYDIGAQRNVCVAHLTIQAISKAEPAIRKGISECGKAKNPQKCKENGQKALAKLKKKKQKAQDTIRKYQMKQPEKAQAGIKKAERKASDVYVKQ
jgi:hypothetical protein